MDAAYGRMLLGALPARELGQAALRRLRHIARHQVRRIVPRGRVVDLAAYMHVACADDVAHRMRTGRAARAPIEPEEQAEARHLIAHHLPDHARALCERADRILAGEAYLFGAWREHSRGELAPGIASFAWTRNPCDGSLFPTKPASQIDRDAIGTDARAVWEIGRLTHIYWLAQAHIVTGLSGTEQSRGAHERGIYARAAALHIRDFLATQPVGLGIHWTCAMEVALRVMRLSSALLLLRDSPELDALFWTEASTALVEHGQFLEDELEDGQIVPGNHLLTDLAGLATLGCLFPELPSALDWRVRILPAFSEELLRQTTQDGLAFEASLAYHRYVTELALLVHSFARRQGLSLGAPALGRLWQMCELIDHATLPDGDLPAIGDNDGTRALEVEIRPSLETRHIGALRSALGGPGVTLTIEPESLWIGGIAGFRRNIGQADPKMHPHRPTHQQFNASGLTVLNDGKGRAVTLWAGDNGQHGLGGHAHNDKLTSEIVLRGHRFVIDPGCPVYMADPSERDRYRSTAAHPTVQIDHLEQAPIPAGRPFLLPESARATLVRHEGQTAWAEHRGYLRLRPGVLHRREVTLPPDAEAIAITDWIIGGGAHVLDLRWPLTSREATLRSATVEERELLDRLEALPCGSGRFDANRVFALGRPGEEGTLALLAIACEQEWDGTLEESTWSPGYGERRCGRTAHIRIRAQCPVSVTSMFVWIGRA